MRSSNSVFEVLPFSTISLNNVGMMLTILTLLTAAAGASAEPALSRISCASTKYTGASTDACSVYLTSPTSNRMHVTLTSNNPAVTVPGEVTVRPGATTTGFSATVAAVTSMQTATITAHANGVASTFVMTLSPATGAPALSLNATSVSFGAVVVNNATTQTVTLTSSGAAPVTVNSLAVTGSGFSASPVSLPATLNPGQTMNVTLTFDPSAVGAATGQLTINSNSSTNSTATVGLSGTGDSHQIDLSWSAPSGSSVSISGYNVYRALGSTTSFAVVDSMDTQTAYTDSSVQAGQSYTYYVTSVDSSGVESVPSNTTSVTVP